MKNLTYFIFFISILLSINISYTKKLNISFLEQEKALSEECKRIELTPNSENVKYIGRFFVKNQATWLALSGSAIEFYLIGKSAEIVLVGDGSSIYSDKDQRPRYGIYVNDEKILDATMGELEKTVELFNYDNEKEVKIRVILLSEAMNGGIGIKNININSCSEKIIRPTEYKKLRIEYIGDSITCAYGVESASPAESFKTTTENFELSYAFLSAKELDADYSGVCFSGSGVMAQGNRMPEHYIKTNSFTFKEEWDFKKFPNDIVVINLGTNDSGYAAESKRDEYIQEYTNFLTLLREKNPNAYIFCTLGMMGGEDLFLSIEKAITLFGDKKVFSFLLPNQKIEDGIGAQYHPNYVTHAKAAKIVAEKIREVIEGKK